METKMSIIEKIMRLIVGDKRFSPDRRLKKTKYKKPNRRKKQRRKKTK